VGALDRLADQEAVDDEPPPRTKESDGQQAAREGAMNLALGMGTEMRAE